MKKFILLIIPFLSSLGFISCKQKISEEKTSIGNINLARNIDFKNPGYLKPSELKMVVLDESNPDSFFKDGKILDIAGDTILLLDNDFIPSKILMFDISNGKYLGQINHQGQGPGEYRFIHGAFINPLTQSVLIPDIDRSYVYNYSLTTDSLLTTYSGPDFMFRLQPIGNIESLISVGKPEENGLKILQFNSEFEKVDSIMLNGFQGSPFNTLWNESGVNGIIFKSDTLFTVESGHLEPIVSFNMGQHQLKDDESKEFMQRMIESDSPDSDVFKWLANYFVLRDFQFTEDNILVSYIYNEKKFSDLYDTKTGKILNRFECDNVNGPDKIVLETKDNQVITIEKLFTKNDHWYGIADEVETSRIMNSQAENSQIMIVSFKI